MSARRPGHAQLLALLYVREHNENAEAELWCTRQRSHWSASQLRLRGLAHDRLFKSIVARGWVKDGELTETGNAALDARIGLARLLARRT